MAENKTQATKASVAAYLAAIADESRRKDCKAVAALMQKVTGCKPKMWGTSIVGFDSYHYTYDSGREGDACVAGFSSRKTDIAIYIVAGFDKAKPLLTKLGKHKAAKACLYIKRLADVDVGVLEKLVQQSVAEMRQRYPTLGR